MVGALTQGSNKDMNIVRKIKSNVFETARKDVKIESKSLVLQRMTGEIKSGPIFRLVDF